MRKGPGQILSSETDCETNVEKDVERDGVKEVEKDVERDVEREMVREMLREREMVPTCRFSVSRIVFLERVSLPSRPYRM